MKNHEKSQKTKKEYINACDHSNQGFTLVELIVVIAIVAILAAITIPAGLGYIDEVRERECLTNRENIAMRIATKQVLDPEIMSDESALDQYLEECITEQTSDNESGGCPSGGTYTGEPAGAGETGFSGKIHCSVHEEDVYIY